LPNWPRGYISLTAYKALAIACYISRKKIGVIGFDNTEYQSISCNLQNRLILKPGSARHFFPQVSSEVDITSHYSSGMSDFFYVASMHFASLKNFPTDRIRNLDINSLTDAFEKDTIENFINLYGV
jgi:hypothetical protein